MRKQTVNIEILKGDLVEVKAYRNLQDTPFDFGTGTITNDSPISEDVYYKINEQALEVILDRKTEKVEKPIKPRLNRYARKREGKRRLEKAEKQSNYFVNRDSENPAHIYKWYLSGCRELAKKETNRRIRNSGTMVLGKGGAYRKMFDYWNTLF